MDYVKPGEYIQSMNDTGTTKMELTVSRLVTRGVLGGAILASATTLSNTAAAQTKIPVASALVIPVEKSL